MVQEVCTCCRPYSLQGPFYAPRAACRSLEPSLLRLVLWLESCFHFLCTAQTLHLKANLSMTFLRPCSEWIAGPGITEETTSAVVAALLDGRSCCAFTGSRGSHRDGGTALGKCIWAGAQRRTWLPGLPLPAPSLMGPICPENS